MVALPKPQIDSAGWVIARVTHRLNDQGYTSTFELEIKPDELEESRTNVT